MQYDFMNIGISISICINHPFKIFLLCHVALSCFLFVCFFIYFDYDSFGCSEVKSDGFFSLKVGSF